MNKLLNAVIKYLKYILLLFGALGSIYVLKYTFMGLMNDNYMLAELIFITGIIEMCSFVMLYYGGKEYLVKKIPYKYRVALLMNVMASLLEFFYAVLNAIYTFTLSPLLTTEFISVVVGIKLLCASLLFYTYHTSLKIGWRVYLYVGELITSLIAFASTSQALAYMSSFNYLLALCMPLACSLFYCLTLFVGIKETK